MTEAGDGYYYPDSEEDICSPGWPERRLARTIQAMRGNGWSIEGLARVFRLTPAGVELYLNRSETTPNEPPPSGQRKRGSMTETGLSSTPGGD